MKIKDFFFLFLIIALLCPLYSISQIHTIPLWKGDIPNATPTSQIEEYFVHDDIYFLRNVQDPNITVYLPSSKNATGEAVIICPGGGYWNLAYHWEGREIAKALNAKGIAGIVLKYRLPVSNNHKVRYKSPLLDAKRALRIVRSQAIEWNIDDDKIGIMGFSAGGHLASTLSTHFDLGNPNGDAIERLSSRPDFSILMYPVISFMPKYAHAGSVKALLGDEPTDALIREYSNELQVTKDTPPTFLVHSSDDEAVPVGNSLQYYQALIAHDVPVEMHIYSYGGHGFSLASNQGYLSTWIDRCADWIHGLSSER